MLRNDALGNRSSSLGVAAYNYNAGNQLTSTSNASYTYDNNGNQLTKVAGSSTTSFAWDFENRLTSVTLPGSGGTVTFKYDPFGRRIQKISPTNGTSIYVYDGDNQIEEVNASGTQVARYTQGLGIDEPLAMLRAGVNSYYHSDGLGSINAMSQTNGSYDELYRYDSFGLRLGNDGNITNPFQYTAREFDSETGLYYYRARYYDPSTGRFLTEDAARFRADANFYDYVHNRPTALRDPSGRFASGVGFTGAGNIGALSTGAGVEGGFYSVSDSLGNAGILDCRAGGIGAVNGVSASIQVTTLFCPNCRSICDMQGTSGGLEGFAGVGLVGAAGGGASVSSTSATASAGGGLGVGAGGGVVVVVGDCTLIYKKNPCPTCQSP